MAKKTVSPPMTSCILFLIIIYLWLVLTPPVGWPLSLCDQLIGGLDWLLSDSCFCDGSADSSDLSPLLHFAKELHWAFVVHAARGQFYITVLLFLQPLCCRLFLPQRWPFGQLSQESGVYSCSAGCINELLSYYHIISLRRWRVKTLNRNKSQVKSRWLTCLCLRWH